MLRAQVDILQYTWLCLQVTGLGTARSRLQSGSGSPQRRLNLPTDRQQNHQRQQERTGQPPTAIATQESTQRRRVRQVPHSGLVVRSSAPLAATSVAKQVLPLMCCDTTAQRIVVALNASKSPHQACLASILRASICLMYRALGKGLRRPCRSATSSVQLPRQQ